MAKQIHEDQEERERIRLKCENDWGIKLTEDQITMGIIEQEEQKLSIWHNQLWPNKRSYKDKDDSYKWKTRVTWDKTIDGYRAIAHRNGFAGIEPTKFVEEKGDLVMATVTVYRLGSDGKRYPYVGEARFSEFAPRNKDGDINLTGQWKTAPYNQLSVAAQRQALRLAFQEFRGQEDIIAAPDTSSATVDDFEDPAEPSRGSPTNPNSPAPEPASAPEPEPDDEDDDEPEGTYVGIPKGGFKFGQMYNDKERIVVAFQREGAWVLAVDSGHALKVNEDGYEVVRRDRQDENPGGLEWEVGATYYDGSKVEKIAPAKGKPEVVWLALDSGFKVRLDRWGKETKRKERKASGGKKKGSEADAAGTVPEGYDGPSVDEVKAMGTKEKVRQAYDGPSVDEVKAMGTKEKVRQACIPLMARYCIDANDGVKISLKAAYERFSGEVIAKGVKMGLNEYKHLFEYLLEALVAHERGEEYPKLPKDGVGQ